ncbi:5-formyltetrahydrofolate cyclo-ligase [Sphingomonas sp.]
MTVTGDKAALRRRMRSMRREFIASPPQPVRPPAPFVARLPSRPVVASYLPVGSEADPAPLVEQARRHGCAIALPWVGSMPGVMRFLAWDAGTALETGPHGLVQPPADTAECAPDIVLVPLLAFDARCHRLGQGAGYYDRALAMLPDAWRLGVAWSVQQVPSVPVDCWDIPLHGVVTEREYFERPAS